MWLLGVCWTIDGIALAYSTCILLLDLNTHSFTWFYLLLDKVSNPNLWLLLLTSDMGISHQCQHSPVRILFWRLQRRWEDSQICLPISVQLSCSSAAEISQDWSSSLRFRTSSEQTGKVIAWSFHCTESVTRFFGEQETNDKAQEWTESVSHFLGAPWGPCTGSWSSSELAQLVLQKSAHTSNTDRRHHPAWASDVIWQHSICR